MAVLNTLHPCTSPSVPSALLGCHPPSASPFFLFTFIAPTLPSSCSADPPEAPCLFLPSPFSRLTRPKLPVCFSPNLSCFPRRLYHCPWVPQDNRDAWHLLTVCWLQEHKPNHFGAKAEGL